MMKTSLTSLAISLLTLAHSNAVVAHEYWIEPIGHHWSASDTLTADIRNGDNFLGTDFPFDPRTLSRAGLVTPSERIALTGTLGDYPAMQFSLSEAGLHLLLLDSTRRTHTYDTIDSLSTFLDYHGLTGFVQHHRERGLPEQSVQEHYYRYSKALVRIEPSSGTPVRTESVNKPHDQPALQPQNQRYELIALNDPINTDKISVQVRFEGETLPFRQVELFYRDPGASVERIVAETDAAGNVNFDISASGDYLVNSVWMIESSSEEAHWVTFWASLFFVQPDFEKP